MNNGLLIKDSCDNFSNPSVEAKQGTTLPIINKSNYVVGARLYVDDILRCTYYFDESNQANYIINEEPGTHSYRIEPIYRP